MTRRGTGPVAPGACPSRRRGRAWLAVLLVLAVGCTGRVVEPSDGPTDTRSPGPTDASTTTRPPPTPTESACPPLAVRHWEPPEGEVHPAAKQRAAEAALALTTYEADSTVEEVVRSVAAAPRAREELRTAAASLHRPGRWSRGAVVYPQMGGLTQQRASVMVVVQQTTGVPGADGSVVTRTLDIRLVRDEQWRFDRLASDGGVRAPRPDDLPPAAAAVLDDPRIELPMTARWDIHRGDVSTALLEVMADLADRTPYGVAVLSSGHPTNVFETSRRSSHTSGHAVDVYRFGGERVVDGRAARGTRTRETVEWLYGDPRVTNLGSPWALDDHGGRSFTDAVHHDHVHVSARAPAPYPPASPSPNPPAPAS